MPNKYLDSVGLAEYTGLIKRDLAPKASPAFTGTPTAPTPTAGDDSTKIATTEFVNDAIDTEITSEIAAEVTRADGKYLPFAGGTLTGVVNGVTPTAGDDSTKLATTEYVQEEVRNHANMPIGHEYFTMNPNIPQGSLPLFGGVYSRETYADLWAWVQQQTGYFITDSAWQAMANSQNGNVPFYSDGDGSTTFRVPSLKCWIKGANGTVTEVGSYLAAGLPNITGHAILSGTYIGGTTLNGAFAGTIGTAERPSGYTSSNNCADASFDASRSSSIYGNANTVVPESIVGMWLVKAYGVIVDTGQIDEQQYLDDRMADLKNVYLPANYLPLSGGTLTGKLVTNQQTAFTKNNSNGWLDIFGGTVWNDGGGLELYGIGSDRRQGGFCLRAHDGSVYCEFIGVPNGSLTWNGKEIERINSTGINSHGRYIRYESGIQICLLYYSVNGSITVTYPLPFIYEPYVAVSTKARVDVSVVTNGSTTSFDSYSSSNVGVSVIAIGRWK